MFTAELEDKIVAITENASAGENFKEELDTLISELPEKNAQGEIKAEIDWLLATVEVTETELVYLKRADREQEKDGLEIHLSLDGVHANWSTIPFDGTQPVEEDVETQE